MNTGKTGRTRNLNQTVSLEVRAHLARQRLHNADLARALGVSIRTAGDLLGARRTWRVDEIETASAWLGVNPADLVLPERRIPPR